MRTVLALGRGAKCSIVKTVTKVGVTEVKNCRTIKVLFCLILSRLL
jgi:hypothetical protein